MTSRSDKVQTEIFTATDWAGGQEHLWCYVVQHRVAKAEGGWEPWESDTKPAHLKCDHLKVIFNGDIWFCDKCGEPVRDRDERRQASIEEAFTW